MTSTTQWLLALCLLSGVALAGDEIAIGTVKTMQGDVSVLRGSEKIAANVGSALRGSDVITTAAASSVGITLRDNTLLSAGPNSRLSLDKFVFDSTSHQGALEATLRRGTLAVISGKIAKADPQAVRFRTPLTTLGVRGTEFILEAEGED